MIHAKIISVLNCFNSSEKNEENIKECLFGLNELENSIESLNDYIVIKYNKCLLFDLSSSAEREDFLLTLDELNQVVFSNILNDKNISEEFFYNIGNLNFKAHRYVYAKKLLDKSVQNECNKPTDITNIEMRFHKRILLAFCLEYSSATLSDYSFAVEYLVGYSIGRITQREKIIDQTIKLAELNKNECKVCNIIETISSDDTDSIMKWIKQNYNNNLISEEIYKQQLHDIAHILAHCLSEYYKLAGERHKKTHPEYVYLLRVSEVLMEELGTEFVTCYATLKIEKGEYYSAIECLNLAKKSLLNLNWDISNNDKECDKSKKLVQKDRINKQIAQINFYIWYFSVFAKKNDGNQAKQEFKDYCDNSNDYTAKTYFELLNLKELLINCFQKLKFGCIEQSDICAVNEAYEKFCLTPPRHTLPNLLVQECLLLKFSYDIFHDCCKIFSSNDDADHKIYSYFSLYKKLYERYNYYCKYQHNRQARKTPTLLYWVDLSNGSFLFRGEKSKLRNIMNDLNIYYSKFTAYSYQGNIQDKLKKILVTPVIKDVSNLMVIPSNESADDDLLFLSAIIDVDSRKEIIDKHNIYIDIAYLNSYNKKRFECFLEENQDNSLSIYIVNDLKVSCSQCIMFAYLEAHLKELQSQLESYIISPVSSDSTYNNQSYRSNELIVSINTESDIYQPIRSNSFASCYSNNDNNYNHAKKLDVKYLVKNFDSIDRLKFIFLFEEEKNQNYVYAFDIKKNISLGCNYAYSDGIYPCDEQGDLLQSVETLYNSLKRTQYRGRGGHDCRIQCMSVFKKIDLIDETQHFCSNYRILKEYLFSYLGVMLDNSSFVLLQHLSSAYSERKRYALFAFADEISLKKQPHFCAGLRNIDCYIRDASVNDDAINIENIYDLEKKLRPHAAGKKFVFMSYLSKKGTIELCEPVYRDCICLQELLGQNADYMIDVASFSLQYGKDIVNSIDSKDCMGAFVYLSPQYMDSPDCLEEIRNLIARRERDKSFFIFPIFLKETCNDTEFFEVENGVDFAKKMASSLREESVNGVSEKFLLFKRLLDIQDNNIARVVIETWKPNSLHIIESRNLKRNLNIGEQL